VVLLVDTSLPVIAFPDESYKQAYAVDAAFSEYITTSNVHTLPEPIVENLFSSFLKYAYLFGISWV